MGYSPQKKPLDLNEFLSQPAKKQSRKGFGYRRPPTLPTAAKPETKSAEGDDKA
ncbi:MAG: hypothetical protein H5U24_13770 [Thioclava marina]|uniref:hypothetical protein n=1 Tax=Thioclava TaxID=285107 RepID=UPI000AC11584|nr:MULTISPECIES: hypothetical protein [Thioclava]MBC7146452.1 hypothetical protein [Thioclava marina]